MGPAPVRAQALPAFFVEEAGGENVQKIVILGCPGAGKSAFALQLRRRTGLPLIHLDNLWWKADRTHVSREEFDRALAAVLDTDAWILDGDYSRTYEPRLRACDAVIFLDYDEAVCLEGVRARVGKPRPDIPWMEEALDPRFVEEVKRYRAKNRPVVLRLLERYEDKERYRFCSREQAADWLNARWPAAPPVSNDPRQTSAATEVTKESLS